MTSPTTQAREAVICAVAILVVAAPLLILAASNEAALTKCMETHSRGVCEQTLR